MRLTACSSSPGWPAGSTSPIHFSLQQELLRKREEFLGSSTHQACMQQYQLPRYYILVVALPIDRTCDFGELKEEAGLWPSRCMLPSRAMLMQGSTIRTRRPQWPTRTCSTDLKPEPAGSSTCGRSRSSPSAMHARDRMANLSGRNEPNDACPP